MFNKAAVQAALRAKASASLATAARATESRIVGLARSQVAAFQAERVVVRTERAAAVAASSVAISAVASEVIGQATAKRVPGKWWNARCTDHIKFHTKREENELRTMTVRDRDEVYLDADANKGCEGDLRLNRLNYYLNNLGVQRSPDQQLFHKHFTRAVLPKIYGTEQWNQESVRVMRSLNIKRIRYEVTAITPRRWGKTWSVALFVLALMLSCPGIRVCVFSTGKRASGSLMEIMLQFMVSVMLRLHTCCKTLARMLMGRLCMFRTTSRD
jgi:hypothetical protein